MIFLTVEKRRTGKKLWVLGTDDTDSDTDSTTSIKGITIHIQRDCRRNRGAVTRINSYARFNEII